MRIRGRLVVAGVMGAALAVGVLGRSAGPPATAAPVEQQAPKRAPLSGVRASFQNGQQPLVPDQANSTAAASAPTRSNATAGGNVRINKDNSDFPQNEVSVGINPSTASPLNIVVGSNNYQIGIGLTGFHRSPPNNGTVFTDPDGTDTTGVIPLVNFGNGEGWDGGGDPAIDFDAQGRAYMANLFFNRTDCRNGVAVSRSVNNGRTWTRPALTTGAGIVAYDNQISGGECAIVHDKEYIAVDRYSTGVRRGNVYVTWTRFSTTDSPIYFSQSSDQGVTWSPGAAISGSDTTGMCVPAGPIDQDVPHGALLPSVPCNQDQFSVPAVGSDGTIYVIFKNFNTTAENQILMVKCPPAADCTQSASWTAPVKVATVFDQHYPFNVDGRQTLSNSQFRLGADTWNVDLDRTTTPNRLYAFWSDNRNGGGNAMGNGTNGGTDTDVFVSISTDGGATWSAGASPSGAIRANQDTSHNDQFMGWGAVGAVGGAVTRRGASTFAPVCVMYLDRRADPTNKLNEVWASCSLDGGTRWTDQRLTDSGPQDCADLAGFSAPNGQSRFIGDYNGLASSVDASTNATYFFAGWVDCRNATPTNKQSDLYGTRFSPVPFSP